MMTEFSGLYCCGLSVFTFPTGAVQLRSVFAIPTEFSTAVVCFYCPARLYRCGHGLFLLSRLNSVQLCGSLFLLSRLSVVNSVQPDTEFSTEAVVCFHCPQTELNTALFLGPRLSRLNLHWWLSHRYTLSGLADLWLTDSVLHSQWTFWTVLFQVFWQKCLSHRDAAEISLRTFPTQSRFGKARQNEKTHEISPTENNKK